MDLSITSTADGPCRRMSGVAASDSSRLRELNRQHRLGLRQRHQVDLRRQHDAERALGADHQLGEVERPIGRDELVEVVAADAAQHLRETGARSRRDASRPVRATAR